MPELDDPPRTRPVVPRRVFVPRARSAGPLPPPPPPPPTTVTLPPVLRRIAGLAPLETETATATAETATAVTSTVTTVLAPILLPPAPAPAPAPVRAVPGPAPAPPHAAPPRQGPGAHRPHRHPRLRLALLLVLATLVAAAVLLVSRGDAVTPASAPTGLAETSVWFDGFDASWADVPQATAYTVRVASDPQMRDVVWSATTTQPRAHVAGPGITEGRDLFVVVTSDRYGVRGLSTVSQHVHTPLEAPGPVTTITTTADTSGFSVRWGAAARATGYQVVVASDAAMTKIVQTSAVLPSTSYRVSVRDGARYFVVVRTLRGPTHAILDRGEGVLHGPDSRVREVRTPLKALGAVGAPTVRALSTSSVRVSWPRATNATRYTVTLAASKTSKQRTVVTTSGTAVTLDGVRPAAMHLRPIFYVRVVADRWGLTRRTSPARAATVLAGSARTPVAFTTTVATYNLLRTQFEDGAGRSWSTRFTLSGKQLRGVGIAGLQETAWGKVGGKRPVDVVAKAAHLKVAKHPHSSKPCTTQNQPVLYAPGKFTLVRCGYQKVSAKITRGIDARYATWVELKDRKSHQTVLVVNAHLTAYTSSHSSASATAQRARAGEAARLAALVKKHRRGGEPVVLTGDYNSYPGRWTTTPLDVLAASGYTSADLTARSSTDGQYASFHDFDGARDNGEPIDHVLMNAKVVATSYRVHVTNSKKAPSDHYEVSAVLQVHRAK